MLKPFLFLGVSFLLVIFWVRSNQEDIKTITTVNVIDKETKKHLSGTKVKLLPKLKVENEPILAGKGNHQFQISYIVPAIVIVEAKGYKRRVTFVLLKKDEQHKIELEKKVSKKESKVQKTNEKEDKKEKKEKKKLNLEFYKES